MINLLKQYFNWFKRILTWLFEIKYTLLSIAVIPITISIFYLIFYDWETKLRLSGMFLELIGLLTVALGLRDTRKLFKHPSFAERAIKWFTNFPKFKNNIHIVVGSASLNMRGGAVSAHVTVNSNKDITIEERLSLLEDKINTLNETQSAIASKVDDNYKKHNQDLEKEQDNRELGDNENKDLIQNASANGIVLEAIGIFWLSIGIILATASEELACLIFCR